MGGLPADDVLPYLPSVSNQQWRLLVALFLQQGIISLILVILLQLLIGRQIEALAGWFRLLLIYVFSGMISLLVSVLLHSPYFMPYISGLITQLSLIKLLLRHEFRDLYKAQNRA